MIKLEASSFMLAGGFIYFFFKQSLEEFIRECIKKLLTAITNTCIEKFSYFSKYLSSLTKPKLITLQSAAHMAYEALGNTPVRDFIDKLNSEHLLGYFIYDLLAYGTQFYGKHSISSIYEPIPSDQLKCGSFKVEGDYNFYPAHVSNPSFLDIQVQNRQVKQYIQKRKKDYKQMEASRFPTY